MFAYLKRHAVENVWCSPEQDNQVIVSPARITKRGGELISASLMGRLLNLPTTTTRYHVYQIGQASPSLLGLLPKTPDWAQAGWTRLDLAVQRLPLFADVYTDAGLHLALHRLYYQYTPSKALVFAIDLGQKAAVDLDQDRLYFRFYSNSYYQGGAGTSLPNKTDCKSSVILNREQIVAYQTSVAQYRKNEGAVYCYVNGLLVETLDFSTVNIGDEVMCVYDASVKKIVDFPIRGLETFTSTMDACYKYLLHPAKDGDASLDFVDDIDVYVVDKRNGQTKGLYFHRNQEEGLRMVTHRDYALNVIYAANVSSRLMAILADPEVDVLDFEVRLYLRKTGIARTLIYDHHRVFELYKLKDADIVGAMVGVNATMPYWKADVLEASAYTRLMRCTYREIDAALIENAYGYNSMTRLLGETPSKLRLYDQRYMVELPQALAQGSTVYEYDAEGYLLGYYPHGGGETYYATHPNARLIEGVVGKLSDTPSVWVGQDLLPIPEGYSYRVYQCYLVNGFPTLQWKDVTGTPHYRVDNGVLHWNNLETEQWLMLRSDEVGLGYSLSMRMNRGVLQFSLTEVVDGKKTPMSVPMGNLDLWLNGRSLIEGLDYFVDFPQVTIVAKEAFRAETEWQDIVVRFTGFCDVSLQRKAAEDHGFVVHGALSNNDRFDVRDDRVVKIVVRGRLRHREDLRFSETDSGLSITDALNGSPYEIEDVVVPIHGWTEQDLYLLRTRSMEVDQCVEDYLSRKLPAPVQPAVSVIPQRYWVVSPFFCQLVSDLRTGVFDRTLIERVLSDMDVMALCAPYEPLLKNDPLNPAWGIDPSYVLIHPTPSVTPIGLDLPSYRFMKQVASLYGRGQIALSPHLVVSLGGGPL